MKIEEAKQALLSMLVHPKDQELAEKVRGMDTASEVTSLIAEYFTPLHAHYGTDLLDFVRNRFSPALWDTVGILINPTKIPSLSHGDLYVVADGTVETVQDIDKHVYYFGDVKLKIHAGYAYGLDTPYPVTADQTACVCAQGNTSVIATDESLVELTDYAHAMVQDQVSVEARGHSFVESRGGHPEIEAYDQSRFLVNAGSADIEMYESARGVIMNDRDNQAHFDILFNGHGLLYVAPGSDQSCDIKYNWQPDFDKQYPNNADRVLWGSNMSIDPEEMRDIILPHWGDPSWHIKEPLSQPMDLDVLKRDIEKVTPAYFLEEMKAWLSEDQDEKAVCKTICILFPITRFVNLDGDFLRSHFTSETLLENNIVVDYNENMRILGTRNHPYYIYGDDLIDTDFCNGYIYACENTLVVGKDVSNVTVDERAHAIVYGQSSVLATENSTVVALDETQVQAHFSSIAYLLDHSQGKVNNHVQVKAYDDSKVEATGTSRATLFQNSSIQADDQCQVSIFGHNKVVAKGEVQVAYPSDGTDYKANIEVLSDKVTLIELPHLEEIPAHHVERHSDQANKTATTRGVNR